jgi:hypothetical protein
MLGKANTGKKSIEEHRSKVDDAQPDDLTPCP